MANELDVKAAEAAWLVWLKADTISGSMRAAVEAAIRAYLAAAPNPPTEAAGTVKVKALEWSTINPHIEAADAYYVYLQPGTGSWWVHHRVHGDLRGPDGKISFYHTSAEARERAQADYTARIMAALDLPPVTSDEAVVSSWVEAARARAPYVDDGDDYPVVAKAERTLDLILKAPSHSAAIDRIIGAIAGTVASPSTPIPVAGDAPLVATNRLLEIVRDLEGYGPDDRRVWYSPDLIRDAFTELLYLRHSNGEGWNQVRRALELTIDLGQYTTVQNSPILMMAVEASRTALEKLRTASDPRVLGSHLCGMR
jgi:hypothetical protein